MKPRSDTIRPSESRIYREMLVEQTRLAKCLQDTFRGGKKLRDILYLRFRLHEIAGVLSIMEGGLR